MDTRIALTGQVPDVVGEYQNALATRQALEMGQMKNALAAQEMADMQQARDFAASPEGVKQKQLKQQRESQMAALEDIKANLPFVTPENWNQFGEYMQTQYGNAGVFGQPYDPKAHEQMLINSGIKKPEKDPRQLNEYEKAKTDYLRWRMGQMPAGDSADSGGNGGGMTAPMAPPGPPKKAPTQDQANAATFGARAEVADKIISDLGDSYSPVGVAAQKTFGAAANWALSPETQKASQAQRDFINAILRKESGATIQDIEFDNAKQQYFPQPGDSPEVKAQKAQNRAIAIQGLKNAAGPAAFLPNVDRAVMGEQTTRRQPKGYITRDKLERRAAERGITVDQAFDEATALGYELR